MEYLLLHTAWNIWSAVAQAYSQIGNDAQIYELKKKVHETKKREMTVTRYYSEVSSLWQELDYYQDFQARCLDDATRYRRLSIRSVCSIFLTGPNVDLTVLTRNRHATSDQSAYATCKVILFGNLPSCSS